MGAPKASIIHVAMTYRRAGSEQVALDLSRLAMRDGHEVTIVALPLPTLDAMADEARELGARVQRIGPVFGHERNAATNGRDLYRLFKATRPAVVHFHMLWAPLCFEAIVAAWMANVPCRVRTEHNPITELLPCIQASKLRVLDSMVHRLVMVSSENLKKHLKNARRPAAKCSVIPNGITYDGTSTDSAQCYKEQMCKDLQLPSDKIICVMVASLEKRKGVLDFVEAARIAAGGG